MTSSELCYKVFSFHYEEVINLQTEATKIIETLQVKYGMRLEEIAVATGISYASIRRYYRGKSPLRPYLKLLKKLEESQGNG